MTFVKLTQMIERKTKGDEVGDLIHYSFTDRGTVWILPANIAAMRESTVLIETSDNVFEEGVLTEILLAGQREPFYVMERAEEVLRMVSGGTGS